MAYKRVKPQGGRLRDEMRTKIAETTIFIRSPGGKTKPIHIGIGQPYQISDGEAACPISMRGLYPKLPDLHGSDTFQALAIALHFVRLTIQAWEKKGYSFQFEEGEPFTLEIWFGKTETDSKSKVRRPSRALRSIPRRK